MSQSLARIHIHRVFITKNRDPFITDSVRDPLHADMATVLQNLGCVPDLVKSQTVTNWHPNRQKSCNGWSAMQDGDNTNQDASAPGSA